MNYLIILDYIKFVDLGYFLWVLESLVELINEIHFS